MNNTSIKPEFHGPKLLEVQNLCIEFEIYGEVSKAVDNISFGIEPGQVLAVVGESGSGKSVTGLALTRLLPPPPGCRMQGEILYKGYSLFSCSEKQIRKYRGRHIAYIFQEPGTALNPVFNIEYQIAEAIKLHRPEVKNVHQEIIQALNLVQIDQPERRIQDYPQQLSGGMQQRVMIAMALACRPELLVADEPTTALDVTIQRQIMDLLKDLQHKLKMSILLITHNFGIVSGFADQVAVMRQGQILEQGAAQNILKNPGHQYTKALIECIPKLGRKQRRLPSIDSEYAKNQEAGPSHG